MRCCFLKIGILFLLAQCVKETLSESNQTSASMIVSSLDGDLTIACINSQQYVVGLKNLTEKTKHCGLTLHERDVADLRKIVIRSSTLDILCSTGIAESIPTSSYDSDSYCKQPNVDIAIKIATKYSDLKNDFLSKYVNNHAFTLDAAGCQKIGKNIPDLNTRYQLYKTCAKPSLTAIESTYQKYKEVKATSQSQSKKTASEILVTFAIENMKNLETETIVEIATSASAADKDRVISSYAALFIAALSYAEIETLGKMLSKNAADKMYILFLEYQTKKLTPLQKTSIISMISDSQIRKNAERML